MGKSERVRGNLKIKEKTKFKNSNPSKEFLTSIADILSFSLQRRVYFMNKISFFCVFKSIFFGLEQFQRKKFSLRNIKYLKIRISQILSKMLKFDNIIILCLRLNLKQVI